MSDQIVSPEFLSALAGSALSLIVAYAPGVSDWYAALPGEGKRLLMLGMLAAAALACYAAACSGLSAALQWPPLTCNAPGMIVLAKAFLSAIIANQATFLIGPSARR